MYTAARAMALDFLNTARNADGSWPYLAGDPGAPEPTVLAAAAGAGSAVGWLSANDLGWAAYLVPVALANDPAAAALIQACAATILKDQGKTMPVNHAVVDIDTTIPGWSWADGTSCWVEPTAYAVISLKKSGNAASPRVADGEKLLRDRQCPDGGWNYGNPRVYGKAQLADLVPTGWATLALAAGPEADLGADRMLDAITAPSSSALSLAILARTAKGKPIGSLADQLAQRQLPNGSFTGRCDRTALAAVAFLAADTGTHVFAV